MENIQLFIASILISYSGFTIAFYHILAKDQIKKITQAGMNKGIGFSSDNDTAYYSKKYEQWKTGLLFSSPFAIIMSIIISMAGGFLNMLKNEWWTILIALFVAYIMYLRLVYILKRRSQISSLLILLAGIILLFFI